MKKGNRFRHLYTAKAADFHEDYLKPQENGSHYDYTMVQAADADVMLQVTGESFSFSASPYTQEELTKKKYNFELEKIDATILCVDAYQSGIGSNSSGPALAECYRVPCEMHFKCTFSVFRKYWPIRLAALVGPGHPHVCGGGDDRRGQAARRHHPD